MLPELLALSPSLFVVVGLTRVHGERRFFLAKRSLRLELFCQHQQQNIPHASEICQERAAERRRDSGLRSLPEMHFNTIFHLSWGFVTTAAAGAAGAT